MLGVALLFSGEHDDGVALIERVDADPSDRSDGAQPHPYLGAALAAAGRHDRARELLGFDCGGA